MALEFTQPLAEMITGIAFWGKARPAHKTDNINAVRRLSRQYGILDISQPYRPPLSVTGDSFTYFFTLWDCQVGDLSYFREVKQCEWVITYFRDNRVSYDVILFHTVGECRE
jgi:hypothetical protein